MNNLYKLRDICKKYGVTRRVIQGYEKEGLIKPISKTESGHLLYDEETLRKIAIIRFLQNYDQLKVIKKYSNEGINGFKLEIEKLEELIPSFIEKDTKNLNLVKRINKLDLNDQEYMKKVYEIIEKGGN